MTRQPIARSGTLSIINVPSVRATAYRRSASTSARFITVLGEAVVFAFVLDFAGCGFGAADSAALPHPETSRGDCCMIG
jgi:hypothetical protein